MFRFGDPGGRAYGTTGNATSLWSTNTVGSSSTFSLLASGARHDTGTCLRFSCATNNGSYLTKNLDAQATWGIATGLRVSNGQSGNVIAAFSDSGTNQVDFRVNGDGSISVTRNGTSLGATSAGVISFNVWYHVEMKVTINNTTGTVALYVNGVQKINLTGQNTRATGNNSANQVGIGIFNGPGSAGSQTVDMDDVIIYDGQTTDANGLADITGPIGDCGLYWLQPTGAGTTTQWAADAGSNYARVNESTPDGDTSYVEDATVNDVDTYACADLPAGATGVKSVALLHYAKKTDVGSRGMKAVVRSGGANTSHATEQSLSSSYLYYWSTWGQNPNNGSPTNWTTTTVNAVEIGQTVSS